MRVNCGHGASSQQYNTEEQQHRSLSHQDPGCPGSRSPPGPAVTGSPPNPEVALPRKMSPSHPLSTACSGSVLGKDPQPWKTMGREVAKAAQLESQGPLGWRRGSSNPRENQAPPWATRQISRPYSRLSNK